MRSLTRSAPTLVLVRVGLLLFGLAAAGATLHWWDCYAWVTRLPSLCLVHRLTGFYCPGCGMGRSLALLAQGEVVASWHQHPFGLPFLLWMTGWALLPRRIVSAIAAQWLVRNGTVPAMALATVLLWWLVTKVR